MKKRQVLGRGLEALIPVAKDHKSHSGEEPVPGIFECPISKLLPNESQPRQRFDGQKLKELAESIRAKGVLQPILVRKRDGNYEILAGERRWRAARLAGLPTVPVLVKESSGSDALEIALVENLQREDLNPLEEAEAYRQLVEEHGLSQEDVSKRVGRERSTVTNTLRLLKLPAAVQKELLRGEISMGHARAILAMPDEQAQVRLARKVISERLSVRECEKLAQEGAGTKKKRSKKRERSPDEVRLLDGLQRRLGTKVELFPGKKRGRLVIHYYSNEQLDKILQLIGWR